MLAGSIFLPAVANASAVNFHVLADMPNTTATTSVEYGLPTALVQNPDGTLFGTALLGGRYDQGGGIFKIMPGGPLTGVHPFSALDGYLQWPSGDGAPFSPLTGSADGSVYGTTYSDLPAGTGTGTAGSFGAVYKLAADGTYATVHSFAGATYGDGANPLALRQDPAGNFYGITEHGGTYDRGVIFTLTPAGAENVVYSFEGASPRCITLGGDGNYYSCLPAGGVIDDGVTRTTLTSDALVKVTPSGLISLLYAFPPVDTNGQNGVGTHPVMLARYGGNVLYGTAEYGGATGGGTVFLITTDGTFTLLHAFDNAKGEGFGPSWLRLGMDGRLYGATQYGGSKGGNGTLFRVSPSGDYTLLHTFDGIDGTQPQLISSYQKRVFYGTTLHGGKYGTGVVFKLALPVRDDLDGDGAADILTSTPGKIVTMTTSNLNPPASGFTQTAYTVGAGYFPVATGDFRGNGIADILWTSPKNDLYLWYGGDWGEPVFKAAYAGAYGSGWSVIGTGDMDGDGKDDIVWLDITTRQFAYWRMDGARHTGSYVASYPVGYYPVVIGDFNGDGKADVVWSSAKRDVWLWLSTGTTFAAKYVGTYPLGWGIAARGDLNGDGTDDLIWKNSDGTHWGYWLMNGGRAGQIVGLNVPAGYSGYQVAAAADYDCDGKADVLWYRPTDGNLSIMYNVVGGTSTAQCYLPPAGSPGSPLGVPAGEAVFNSGLVKLPGSAGP